MESEAIDAILAEKQELERAL
jgi:hypothetical protein